MALPEPMIQARDIQGGAITGQKRPGGSVTGKSSERRIKVAFPVADAPTPFLHGLGRIPTSFTPVLTGKGDGVTYIAPGIIYSDIPIICDSRRIVLKCSVAGTSGEVVVR